MEYYGFKLLGGLFETPHVRALDTTGLLLVDKDGVLGLTIKDGGEIDANSNKIVNLGNPTTSYDAANKEYVDTYLKGLEWQDSVLDRYDPFFYGGTPGGPSDGDRYLSTATANGWTNNYIYEWDDNNSQWVETIPNEGFALWVEDENYFYVYNNSGNWVKFGTVVDHGNLIGLLDNDHPQYVMGVSGVPLTYDSTTQEITFNYDITYFQLSGNNLQIKESGIDHGSISGLEDNDHTQYVMGIYGLPLTYDSTNQTIRFNYDSNDFQLSGDNLQVKDSGIDHGSISGLEDNDHNQYVMDVSGAPLTYDSTNQKIDFNYDPDDFELDGDNLKLKDSTLDSRYRLKQENILYPTEDFVVDSSNFYNLDCFVIDSTDQITAYVNSVSQFEVGYECEFVVRNVPVDSTAIFTIVAAPSDVIWHSSLGGTVYIQPGFGPFTPPYGEQFAVRIKVIQPGVMAFMSQVGPWGFS